MTVVCDVEWYEAATKYHIFIFDRPEYLESHGGRFLVVIIIGNYGTSYFHNYYGWVDPGYLATKHSNLTYRDAEIVARIMDEKLKSYIEKEVNK